MILFISDLHLSPERPDITQAFLHFLNTTAKNAEALYILGDFFDAWVGDDDDTAEFACIKRALKSYSENTAVYFMVGNRDFLIGKQFAEETGCKLLPEPTLIQLANEPTLLIHGDSLCTGDAAYMEFRAMVRNTQWQQAILSKPLAERKALAAQMRAQSAEANSLKASDIMDVTPSEVAKLMEEHKVKRLIHGHTHRPDRHELQTALGEAERIVLGDWEKDFWYLKWDGQMLSLVQEAIE